MLFSLSKYIRAHRLETIIFVSIIALSALLRLYNIRNTVVFLGDEGRDALVVKRIIVDGKFTLLGPTASVGGFYLGPIYYYFMVPFLYLWNLDPVGPAVMVALMGTATVAILYGLNRAWFGPFAASITSLLYATAPGIIRFSRSSWNPNPMPLFSLICISSLHYALTRKRISLAVIAGASFGIAVQLHYLGLALGIIMAALTLLHLKKQFWLKFAFAQFIGFLIGASPFVAFEVRHGFPNTKTILEFVTRNGQTTGPRSLNPLWLIFEITRFNFESVLGSHFASIAPTLSWIFLALILAAVITLVRKRGLRDPLTITILTFWTLGTVGLGLYRGQLHYHYFEYLFPAPFLVMGLLLAPFKSLPPKILIALATITTCVWLVIQAPTWEPGSRLIEQTQRISHQALELTSSKPFNFALIAQGNSDHAYRFFFEVTGRKPIALEDEVTDQLIVICELKPEECMPLGHPLWEIAGFGRAEIVSSQVVYPHITIIRLIHHLDSLDLVGHPAPKG